jgi:hypothetical protein
MRLPFSPTRGLSFLVAVSLVIASGCSKPVGNVSGKVTLQGKALPGGYVNFSCEGDTPTVKTSVIQEDGSYAITGMPVGTAKIAVQGVLGPQGPGSKTGGPGGTAPPGGRKTVFVPPQYGNADKSKLTYDVTSGAQTHDIVLP